MRSIFILYLDIIFFHIISTAMSGVAGDSCVGNVIGPIQ